MKARGWVVGLIVVGLLVIPVRAWSWGQNGHRIVAEVADHHLTDQARREIAVLLDGGGIAEASTWPDDIRSDPCWDRAKPWHFLSIDDGETLATTARSPDGDLLEALGRFEGVLRDPAAAKEEKVKALRFYVHFVGDVHQPLHVGRRADRGGNGITVYWFGERRNLHSVWDSGLIDSKQLSFTEFAHFVDDADPVQVAAWQAAPYEEWVRESFCLRPEVYDFGREAPSDPEEVPRLSYGYGYKEAGTIEEQLVKAGVRLAARLNSIFAGTEAPAPPSEIPDNPGAWCGTRE